MIPTPRKIVPWTLVALLGVLAGVPSTLAQPQAPSPEDAFTSAVQLYHQRLYADAMTAFDAYRAAHPDDPQAGESLYLEAQAALAQQRDEEAFRLFDAFQRSYPDHPRAAEAQLSLAQYLIDEGNTTAARRQLSSLAENPTSSDQGARALYLLGRTERERGNLEQALEYFDRVRTEYPNAQVAPAAFYALGATQVRLERYDQAARSFERLGQAFPSSPYAQNLGTALGEVYYRLERYKEAAAELDAQFSALEGTQRARAHFLLAEAYNQLRAGEDAVVHYRRVIDQHAGTPYVGPAQYGLAWHYLRAGEYQEAAEAFGRVRTEQSGRLADRATYYEAVSRAQAGAPDRAIELYQTVAQRAPTPRLAAEALYESGLLRYQQEQYGAAAAAFRSLVRDYPDAPRVGDAYYWLGNSYLVDEELDQALNAYNQASSRDAAPDSLLAEARFQKAWAQYQDERYSDATSSFLSLTEASPNTERGRDALFWGADSYYQLGNFGRAQALFGRYLENHPKGDHAAGARYALAWTHFKQQRYEAAARFFREFLDSYTAGTSSVPYRQDARLRLADSYYALNRYQDAVEVYRRIEGDGSDYALYQAGEALNYAERSEEALRSLRRLVDRYPESPWRPDALYRIASIHFQEQSYDEAESTYRELLEEYPNHELAPEAKYGIGDSRYNAGDMEAAVSAYRRVLEEHPESPTATEAASALFFALSAAGQSDRAEKIIASIAESNPDANLRDRLRFQRAKAAYQSGESKKALSLFQEFVRTSSTSSLLPDSYYYLGLLYADQNQATEAKNYLEQLVNQYPDSDVLPEGALRLGDIYLDEERYQQAAEAYRAAAESDAISSELRAQAQYGQSMALLNMDQNEQARDILNGILEENEGGPLRASAQLGLARINEDEGQSDEALDLYRTVVQAADGETGAEALYRLGRLLRQQDQPRRAIEELDRMSSLFAGHPEWIARSLLEQARAHRQLGNTGQAAQLYDEVTSSYPGTPFADTADDERTEL
jgi:TolA-binding protein